jgi:CubicO group peptidase (beta-lactamase class C family)
VGAAGSLGVEDTFDIYSVTKTMTATMIMRLVEAGVIDLDAPLPPLSAVPSFPSSKFTVRELLTHMTGLVNYRDTPRYKANPSSITSPAAALADAASQPLLFTPGAASGYSSTNYLALGFLLEDLTAKPFAQLLHDEIVQPLGLEHTYSTPPAPGEPNFSTGGVIATSADLLAWSVYYLRDHAGLSDASWAMMSQLNPLTALGGGLIGYCPCPIVNGDYDWLSVGYAGSTTIIQYSPTTDTVITINLSEPLWKSDAFFAQILGLFESLRMAVA